MITALVDKGTEDQLRHQLQILPEWDLEIFEEEDHVRAVFRSKFPRGKKRIRMEQLPVIFKCSHHRQGNSDLAADLFLQGIKSAGGNAETIVLGDMDFKHCIGCLKCRTTEAHRCIFAAQDNAQELYQKIIDAPFTFFSAPIYFYHLPSRLKTFIDRGQWAFEATADKSDFMFDLAERPAYACMVAGRPQGEKLFEGAELSLKFFLRFFKSKLQPAITFRGIDEPHDLKNSQDKCAIMTRSGELAWKRTLKDGC